MTIKQNLIGQKFGRLTVINEAPAKNNNTFWKCICECGNEKNINASSLKNGSTKSCGCIFKNRNGITTSDTNNDLYKLYNIYRVMIYRCNNKNHKRYADYGGRGIKVCDRWMESFENFLEDMKDTYQPGLSIDRINNDGNYEPSNCQWSTRKEQQRNKRTTKLTLEIVNEIRNSKISIRKLAMIYNVSVSLIREIKSNIVWV